MLGLTRSKLRRDLLAFCFSNVDRVYFGRELARELHVDPTNLSRELRRLVDDGIFLVEAKGNHKYFRLNRKHATYFDLKRIIAKTIGAGPQIGKALRRVRGVRAAVLYGSFAAGREDAASDIDVLVVGDTKLSEIISTIAPLERRFRRDINVTVYSPYEFARKKSSDPFLRAVFKRPLQILFGHLWI